MYVVGWDSGGGSPADFWGGGCSGRGHSHAEAPGCWRNSKEAVELQQREQGGEGRARWGQSQAAMQATLSHGGQEGVARWTCSRSLNSAHLAGS